MRVPLVRIPTRPWQHAGLVVALPLAISGILVLVVTAPSWQGWPTATNTFALMPFVFGAPLIAAVQAFESSRLETTAVTKTWVARINRVKIRENFRSLSGSWICVLICALMWFSMAQIMTGVKQQSDAEGSVRPILGYVALAILAVAVGHLVGKVRVHLTVSVAAAFVLVLAVAIYATQYANVSPARVLPLFPLAVLWTTSFIATAAAMFSPFDRSRSVAAACLAVVLVACNVAAASDRGNLLRTDIDERCVDESGTTICVWREHEVALEPLKEISRRVQDVAPEDMLIPTQVNEFGLDGTIDVSNSFTLDNSFVRDQAALTVGYVYVLINHTFAGHDNSEEGRAARFSLESLLIVAAYPEISDAEAARMLLDLKKIDQAREVVHQGTSAMKVRANSLFMTATRDLK